MRQSRSTFLSFFVVVVFLALLSPYFHSKRVYTHQADLEKSRPESPCACLASCKPTQKMNKRSAYYLYIHMYVYPEYQIYQLAIAHIPISNGVCIFRANIYARHKHIWFLLFTHLYTKCIYRRLHTFPKFPWKIRSLNIQFEQLLPDKLDLTCDPASSPASLLSRHL